MPTRSPSAPGAGQLVKSAERTLRLLEELATSERRQTLAELGAKLEIPKSSLHGLLRTLVTQGWAETDPSGMRFGLGIRALLAGNAYLKSDEVVTVAQDVMDDLSAALEETIHLAALDGDQIVYLAKRDTPHALRLVSGIGVRLPAHATALGKALLAELPDARLAAIVRPPLRRMTASTVGSMRALKAQLAEVRERGYAEDFEESTAGIDCFAVPIEAGLEPARHAISCSIPVARFDEARKALVIERLVAAGEAIRARAGATQG